MKPFKTAASGEWLVQACGPQNRLVGATSGAAVGQDSVDRDRWNRPDAELLGALGNLDFGHVQHRDVARRTGDFLDPRDEIPANRTPGAKDFDLALLSHVGTPFSQ